MEPVSILLATGAIAIYAAHRAEQMSEKARRGPITLPEMMDAKNVDDTAPVQILAVHVRSGRFRRCLLRQHLKVRVKYGDPGVSIHCDTTEAVAFPLPRSPASRYVSRLHQELSEENREPLNADFGTTCLFLGQRNSHNKIRLRLVRAGLLGKAIAKTELEIPALGLCSPWMEFQPELIGCSCRSSLGHLDIALETKVMLKGELRQYLQQLGAKKQHEGFLMSIQPVTEGEVTEDAEDDIAVVHGEVIRPEGIKRPLLCGLCNGRRRSRPNVLPA
mmetsp:Transcript_51038/g.95564  ORF Transcript_51038/g.95564 Transcript_51038/m.95564 type:complete len:275 (-) Transcript_51038:146-970(-)